MAENGNLEKRLDNIESVLEKHGKKLDSIGDTLQQLAVQHQKISRLESDTAKIQDQINSLVEPQDGVIPQIKAKQYQCPINGIRTQVNWLWTIVLPMGIALLGAAAKLLGVV